MLLLAETPELPPHWARPRSAYAGPGGACAEESKPGEGALLGGVALWPDESVAGGDQNGAVGKVPHKRWSQHGTPYRLQARCLPKTGPTALWEEFASGRRCFPPSARIPALSAPPAAGHPNPKQECPHDQALAGLRDALLLSTLGATRRGVLLAGADAPRLWPRLAVTKLTVAVTVVGVCLLVAVSACYYKLFLA